MFEKMLAIPQSIPFMQFLLVIVCFFLLFLPFFFIHSDFVSLLISSVWIGYFFSSTFRHSRARRIRFLCIAYSFSFSFVVRFVSLFRLCDADEVLLIYISTYRRYKYVCSRRASNTKGRLSLSVFTVSGVAMKKEGYIQDWIGQ